MIPDRRRSPGSNLQGSKRCRLAQRTGSDEGRHAHVPAGDGNRAGRGDRDHALRIDAIGHFGARSGIGAEEPRGGQHLEWLPTGLDARPAHRRGEQPCRREPSLASPGEDRRLREQPANRSVSIGGQQDLGVKADPGFQHHELCA